MQLFLLKPIDPDAKESPWHPWYDKAFGFVMRAASERDARRIADDHAGDENAVGKQGRRKHPWLDEGFSSCVHLSDDGLEELILRDFRGV